ncbi:putative cbs domain-containing protein [Diaporthe ampelina]|uniref:Putative cbs domain-containing protein n=1 Tax=Diaporthe ampelina TaxID=1214573 RepID=A0A0G2FGY3_9PEZI|nr:putative cbs domain-containing protein [Diaporthe ampelina]
MSSTHVSPLPSDLLPPESPTVSPCKAISFSTWKTLQELRRAGQLDTKKKLALHQFVHHVKEPTADLPVYLTPLQSRNFAFISHLRLAGSCLIKAEELLYLPQWSKNLGVLELMEPSDCEAPFPRLSDRLFKAWSLSDDPFPKLKGIGLSTHSSITEQSLQYLTQFPALIMLDITAAKQDWTQPDSLANAFGWIYCNWAEAPRWHDDDNDDDERDRDIVPVTTAGDRAKQPQKY